MTTVTKKELIDRIASAMRLRRVVVKDLIQRFLDEMMAELAKGNRLEFRDFGVFEPRIRKARMAQNPRTLQRVQVPLRTTVRFKGGRLLKEVIQKGAGPRGGKSDRTAAPSAAPAPPPPS
ncbi:MAG: HU family DNA-binding protein [Planctomycetota bacterium]|jgi:integration host factor subunit beta|nr:HU family DNA-binding protein [Planctomycetota bacterium]